MTPCPFCLSGTPAMKDSSTIYFPVARMCRAGVVSSLSGKWSIAVFVPAGLSGLSAARSSGRFA